MQQQPTTTAPSAEGGFVSEALHSANLAGYLAGRNGRKSQQSGYTDQRLAAAYESGYLEGANDRRIEG